MICAQLKMLPMERASLPIPSKTAPTPFMTPCAVPQALSDRVHAIAKKLRLNRSGSTLTIPSGSNGIYHVFCVISQHCNSSNHDDRGVFLRAVRNRSGTLTYHGLVVQWIEDISGSSYRQQISDVLLDLQGGDIVYWDTTDRTGTNADVHKPNTQWYVRMIMPT